uniref:Putative DNA binding, helix-turn-helix domain containing protein n=1 Tax=viral metagenome TaxID=1070528 RepID=A0A6H1ZM43_9ZZZZ
MSLGENIKIARIRAKLSQGEMAKRAEISQNYLCLIEGDNQVPSIAVLDKIASACNTTSSELMKESE